MEFKIGDCVQFAGDTSVPPGRYRISGVDEYDDAMPYQIDASESSYGTQHWTHAGEITALKGRVYLAGPMTGYQRFNFDAFEAAAADLRARGYAVISPAEMDLEEGFEPSDTGDNQDPNEYAAFLARDIQKIAEAGIDAIVVLPGWERSGGAQTEVAFVRALKKPVWAYPSLDEVPRLWGVDVQLVSDSAGFPVPDQYLPDIAAARREIRTVNEATGGEKGSKPERMELIPWDMLREFVAPHYAAGAAKYADNNWRRGYAWSLSFGALQRHAAMFWSGEDLDEETQTHHMAAVVFHGLALLLFSRDFPELDDRPYTALERSRT